MSRSTPTTTHVDILAIHDGGTVDPDDAVALAYLAEKKITVYIMACGEGSNPKTLAFLKDSNTQNYIRPVPENTIIRMNTLLLIGPHADRLLPLLDFSVCQHIVFQGNTTTLDQYNIHYLCKTPCNYPSVNERGNESLFKQIHTRQQQQLLSHHNITTVRVVTTAECYENKNMFGATNLSKNGALHFLKPSQTKLVWASLLKNFAGRMHPRLQYNKHAESLINGAKPKGANYYTAIRVHDHVQPTVIPKHHTTDACIKYIQELKLSLKQKNCTLNNENTFLQKLIQTTERVADVLGIEPIDPHGSLLTSTTIDKHPTNIADMYPNALLSFKNVPYIVPAYDFAAALYILALTPHNSP